MKKESNNEEGFGIEGWYSSDRGCSKHSPKWQWGMLTDKTGMWLKE
jgi:hypothetical protein